MNRNTKITLSVISVVFSLVPMSASAQTGGATGSWSTPQPNGIGCTAPSDCISGYCSSGNVSSRVCAVNPTGTGGGTGTVAPGVTLINPLKSGTSLTSFLNNILDFVIQIGSIIVILMLVFVGFKFVVAQGKDTALVEARKMLLWTIIGALVLLGAKAISAGILATVQSLGG
jgi:hypothetical protein